MGPTSRDDFPQKEQVVTRLPRNPPGGLLVLIGGLPLPPPPLPVRRSFGIGRAFLEGQSPRYGHLSNINRGGLDLESRENLTRHQHYLRQVQRILERAALGNLIYFCEESASKSGGNVLGPCLGLLEGGEPGEAGLSGIFSAAAFTEPIRIFLAFSYSSSVIWPAL